MRPAYQTEQDELAEEVIATRLAKLWNCEMLKFGGKFNAIDRVAVRQEGKKHIVRAFAEIKKRTYSADDIARMGTMMVGFDKIATAKAIAVAGGLPLFLIVCTSESDLWCARVDNAPITEIVISGRIDRADEADITLQALYDFSLFKKIGTLDKP